MNNRLMTFALGILALPLVLIALSVGAGPTSRSGTTSGSRP